MLLLLLTKILFGIVVVDLNVVVVDDLHLLIEVWYRLRKFLHGKIVLKLKETMMMMKGEE